MYSFPQHFIMKNLGHPEELKECTVNTYIYHWILYFLTFCYICFMTYLFIYSSTYLSINVLFIYTFEGKLQTSVHFNSKHVSYAYQVEFNICLLFFGGNIYWMKCRNFKWWVLMKCIHSKIHVYVSSDSLACCEVWKSLLLPRCLSQ